MTQIVGRDLELEVLADALAAEGTRVVFLIGDAGSGKTRLLAEAEHLAEGQTIFKVRGFQPEQVAPLVAASTLLAALAAVDPRLDRLLEQDTPTTMVQIFEMVHRAIQKIGGDVVLLVDDEQWLDPTTRALLHYVARSAQTEVTDLCLVSATRPSAASAEMHESLQTALGDLAVTLVGVPPLGRADGVALLRQLTPRLSVAAAEGHWETAGGSPFWLSMLARGEGSGLTMLVQNRLSACSPRARFVLEMLAVAARPVDLELLPQLLDQPASVVGNALEELRDRGLVLTRSDTVSVVHDLVREEIAADLSQDRSRQLNLRVARWLEQSEEPAVLLAAMFHRKASGQPVNDLVARIVASPRRAWLGADGTKQLVNVVISNVVDPDAELLMELATLASDVAEFATALPLWARVADGRGAAILRHRAAIEAGRAAYRLVDRETARQWLRRATSSSVADIGSAVAVEVLESDVLRWLESKFDEAAACSVRAMQLVDEATQGEAAQGEAAQGEATGSEDDEEVRAALVLALGALGDDAMVRGDIAAIERCAERLEQVSQGDDGLGYTAALYRITAASLQGEPRRALELVEPLWNAAVESGSPARQIEMCGYVLYLLIDQLRLREAEETAIRVRPLVARMTHQHRRLAIGISVWHSRSALLNLELLGGDWRRGLAELTDALGEMTPHNAMTCAAVAAEHWSLLSAPNDPMVAALSSRAMAMAADVGCPRCGEEASLRVARTRARAGDLDGARTLLDGWRRKDAPADVNRWVTWARALVLAGEGRHRESADSFDELDMQMEASGSELDRLWLLLDRAHGFAGHDKEVAVSALESVARRSSDVGATNLEALAQRQLRSLGVRPWRRGPTAGSALTEREREIAEMVAAGMTNPEIAAALFLSRKTVERHVSHVLTKLGARNRAEVAATWSEWKGTPG